MSTKLTYTGAEVQELLDKIEKGGFDNAKTLEGHPASYFARASEFTSLAESFATEQGRISFLYGYFNNGSANNALKLGGQLPTYYATATQYEILQRALSDFKSLFDSMFEKDSEGNIHAKLSLWSSGGITAGGVGSGGSGGGGISYNRLDSWADYSADKAGYVLSALLGKDLDNRVSALANAGYITASYLAPYALRSEIPSLAGYATQGWVVDNFLSKSGGQIVGELAIKGGAGKVATIRFMPNDGAINHWLGVNTIGELWFTNNGWSQQWNILHAGNYAYYITNSYIKSTLGISDWALAATKPTYTASEVGALSVNGTAQSALKMTPEYLTDLNSAAPWRFFDMNTGYGSADGNKPNIAWVSGITGTVAGSSNYRWQLATTTGNARPYFRQESKGNWNNWRTLAFTTDIPTKLSQLTDDVVAGKYLPITGGTANGSITANSFIGNLTGNADSATKLATSRTIWGQYFDGTQNVEGNLTNVNRIRFSEAGAQIFVRGSNYSSGMTDNDIGIFATMTTFSGNVAIGGVAANEKLYVYGNGKFTGALTANSLTIGGVTLTYDSVNEALCINGNMYALGGITAGGAGISAYTSLEARVARLEQQLNIS